MKPNIRLLQTDRLRMLLGNRSGQRKKITSKSSYQQIYLALIHVRGVSVFLFQRKFNKIMISLQHEILFTF